MGKGVLVLVLQGRNGFFIKKQNPKKPPNGFFDAETLSYVSGNSKYIYMYLLIYSYMYV